MKKTYTTLTICILLSCCTRTRKPIEIKPDWIYNGSIEITSKLYQHEFIDGQDTIYKFSTEKDLYMVVEGI